MTYQELCQTKSLKHAAQELRAPRTKAQRHKAVSLRTHQEPVLRTIRARPKQHIPVTRHEPNRPIDRVLRKLADESNPSDQSRTGFWRRAYGRLFIAMLYSYHYTWGRAIAMSIVAVCRPLVWYRRVRIAQSRMGGNRPCHSGNVARWQGRIPNPNCIRPFVPQKIIGWHRGSPVYAIAGGVDDSTGPRVVGSDTAPGASGSFDVAFFTSLFALAGSTNLKFNSATNQLLIAGFAALTSSTVAASLPFVDIVVKYSMDTTGVNNQDDEIAAALAAEPAGSIFWVRQGTFKTNSGGATISLNKHVRFWGNNRTDVVFKSAHATVSMFTHAEWFSGFENVGFDSSVTRTAGHCVVQPNTFQYPYMRQCEINNHWSSVLSQAHLSDMDDVEIRNMGDKQTGGVGAAAGQCVLIDCAASSAHDMRINRLITDNSTDPTTFAGIRITQVASLELTNSNIINATNCLDLVPGASQVIPSVTVIDTFFDNSVIGANFGGNASGTIQRVLFTNVSTSSHTTGDGVQISQLNVQGFDMNACAIYQNTNGINVTAAGAGGPEWTLRGSRLAGNSAQAVKTVAGAGHALRVQNNIIGNVSGFGANGSAFNIAVGSYKLIQITDNSGLESNSTPGYGTGIFGTVSSPGQFDVSNNMGTVLKGLIFASSAAGLVTSGVAETLIYAHPIPANAVLAQQAFRITISGISSSTGTLKFTMRAGPAGTIAGDAVVTNFNATAAGVANSHGGGTFEYIMRSVGAPGSIIGDGTAWCSNATTGTPGLPTPAAAATTAVTTTAAWFLTIGCACSVGTFTVQQVKVEAL